MTTQHLFWTFSLGGLSALSLVIGALIGVMWHPRQTALSMMTAFGAGALLAALSVELMAPTVLAVVHHNGNSADHQSEFFALVIGALAGGIIFILLDELLNSKGGYLRKTATIIAHWSDIQKKRRSDMLARLAQIDFLRAVPTEHIETLVGYISPVTYQDGEQIFKAGDQDDSLYFIEKGDIIVSNEAGEEVDRLHAGEIMGEIALLTGAPRTAGARAVGSVTLLRLSKRDFERLSREIPELDAACKEVAGQRMEMIAARQMSEMHEEAQWLSKAARALKQGASVPSRAQVRSMAHEQSGAPLAIWLGILLDGIPESFVIGATSLDVIARKTALSASAGAPAAVQASGGAPAAATGLGFFDIVPYALIAGLFLSNFPEALSSSVGMKNQGWGKVKILGLWSSIMIMSAIGAAVGYLAGAELDATAMGVTHGLAAGAMLTMIAQTMIPEAFVLSGRYVGLSTLAGFLSVCIFKLLE